MKKITSTLFIIAAIGIYNGQTTSKITTTQVAKNALQSKLEGIPEGYENDFGFLNRAQFKKAILGNPIHTSAIDAEGNVLDLNEDKFPVLVDGKTVGLLTVANVNGEYKATEYGSPILAKKIEDAEKNNGKINSLLRAFSIQSNFVTIDSQENKSGKSAKSYISLESINNNTISEAVKRNIPTNTALSLDDIRTLLTTK